MSDNAAQTEFWNTVAGLTWAEHQAQLDRQLRPLGAAGMQVLSPQPGEAVLDIGCGCGDTSFALAGAVGETGSVLGLDISEPMLAVARSRAADSPAAPVFTLADAQTADLGEARFDAAFSRFGVMFFNDPTAAFANIRRMLKPGGRITFVCWRPATENPWMSVPFQAALPLLPPQPERDPLAPGPFAFANPDRVRGILSDAGFSAITITPFDTLIGSGGLDETLALTGRVGPLAAVLRENPDLAGPVQHVVREALSAYLTAEGVMMPAAVWVVSAANA
ncbi:class I SAM-dependent methyltransferase [Acidisoma cellulosilytica]|uniref:Class I SAM-dependent methyltransferase n=1 Tax=Acidisoma cellulosilyticum TaxID=2802395 RepID=A0A963Z2U4_9PROT|nr:class I SAM-dependent methyltransferase [Acidisoma cellulosilyticum]MCB8881586.1 class I SAM-dependent methyltransferase [Acidisoma cellulosilyticum]